MKKIFFLFLFVLHSYAEDAYKVVYDLKTSNLETLESRFIKGIVANKNHYESQFKELEVIAIIHGGAYKFFLNDPSKTIFSDDKEIAKADKNLKTRLQALADTYGVKFQMCQVGATSKKLKREDIHSFVTMIPNTTIGLIDAQNEGYAYVPVD